MPVRPFARVAGDMECRELRERLLDVIEGTLEDADRIGVRTHLAGCLACAEVVERYRRVVEALSGVPDVPAPPGLLDSIRRELHARSRTVPARRTRVLYWLPRAAAALAAGLLLAAAWMILRPGPGEPYRVVAVEEPSRFQEEDLLLKGYLEGSFGLGLEIEGDPVLLLGELMKDRGP